MKMSKVRIIGSGMAGLGAAYQFKQNNIDATMFEKKGHYGGHTASHSFKEGFVFDEGPHISFTSDERMKSVLADSVKGGYRSSGASVNNYWKGHWIKHPAQCNLYGLPTDLQVNIIKDFINASQKDPGEIKNYEDWLYASYGKTFSETFPMEYTKKYHTTEAKNLSTDWLGPRLYRPDIEEVLKGALTAQTSDVHYITEFRYPKTGGFVSFLDKLSRNPELQLNQHAVEINPANKTIRFKSGTECDYNHLVSSMPLPDLISLIKNAPSDVVENAAKLACSEVVVVNLGIGRPDVFDKHWTYFYDEDISFSRLSTPYLQSIDNVPKGCSSLQAEIYFSKKYKPLNKKPSELIDIVIRDLKKCGILREDEKIVFTNAMHIPYGNVIFDLERKEALSIVHGYLDELGIAYCGRYGEWEYIWTDESFKSGENAALRILESMS